MCGFRGYRLWPQAWEEVCRVLWRVVFGLGIAFVAIEACEAQPLCVDGCWEGRFDWNDAMNDYWTALPVCIDYALPAGNLGGKCARVRIITRWFATATRICSAPAKRGENAPWQGIPPVNPHDSIEPEKCLHGVYAYDDYYYGMGDEGEGSTFRMTPRERAALAPKGEAKPR